MFIWVFFARGMVCFRTFILLLVLNCITGRVCGLQKVQPEIIGYRIENFAGDHFPELEFEPTFDAFRVPRGFDFHLRLYGRNLSNFISVAFTHFGITDESAKNVVFCDKLGHTQAFSLTLNSANSNAKLGMSAVADIFFDADASSGDVVYYLCLEHNGTDEFIHQGNGVSLIVYHLQPYLFPLPLQIFVICCCLAFSWVFSGLNLGLMSLDCTELKLIVRCGSADDRRYAKALEPIRRRGNTLLCTLLLANTIVNAGYTLLLDDVVGEGIYVLAGSTVGIVLFGEILPQAVCSRYGLKVGYYSRWIVQFALYALYPLTLSMGKLLDCIFGHEIHQVYSRDKLREIVKMSCQGISSPSSPGYDILGGHLKPEEVNIVTGALQMYEKTVRGIMKRDSEIFMLDLNVVIDFDLVATIAKSGYTRIPIYANGNRNNIVGLLNAKDLLGIDPEDKLPLNSVVEFYAREVIRVEEDRTILAMLNTFKEAKVHLAIVDHLDKHSGSRTVVGIVTLEDVIEFIVRDENVHEKNALKDILRHEKVMEKAIGVMFTGHTSMLMGCHAEAMPQQLCTATIQFLMANVELFRKEVVERRVLAQLLRFPGLFIVKKYSRDSPSNNVLYSYNEPADFFMLILQGTCHVSIGREQLPFEAGPFHFFGLEALQMPHEQTTPEKQRNTRERSESLSSISPSYNSEISVFRPDFSVEMTSDVQYVRLTLAMYHALMTVSRLARLCNRLDDVNFIVEKLQLEIKLGFVSHSPACSVASTPPLSVRQNSLTSQVLPESKIGNYPTRRASCIGLIKPPYMPFVRPRSGSVTGFSSFSPGQPSSDNKLKCHLETSSEDSASDFDENCPSRAVPTVSMSYFDSKVSPSANLSPGYSSHYDSLPASPSVCQVERYKGIRGTIHIRARKLEKGQRNNNSEACRSATPLLIVRRPNENNNCDKECVEKFIRLRRDPLIDSNNDASSNCLSVPGERFWSVDSDKIEENFPSQVGDVNFHID